MVCLALLETRFRYGKEVYKCVCEWLCVFAYVRVVGKGEIVVIQNDTLAVRMGTGYPCLLCNGEGRVGTHPEVLTPANPTAVTPQHTNYYHFIHIVDGNYPRWISLLILSLNFITDNRKLFLDNLTCFLPTDVSHTPSAQVHPFSEGGRIINGNNFLYYHH